MSTWKVLKDKPQRFEGQMGVAIRCGRKLLLAEVAVLYGPEPEPWRPGRGSYPCPFHITPERWQLQLYTRNSTTRELEAVPTRAGDVLMASDDREGTPNAVEFCVTLTEDWPAE